MWLNSEEASAEPAQRESYMNATSEDTVRSRSFTGKTARMLKNEWTEAWAAEDTPDPLGMPLQGMVTFDAVLRTHNYAGVAQTQDVAFSPVGQVVGQIDHVQKSADVVRDLLTEYVDSVERMNELLADGGA